MPVYHRPSQGIIPLAATLFVLLLACEDTIAQRGGGGRRGRGGGGRIDLSPLQRDQFSNLPTGAYDLVKENEETLRRLPLPIRTYTLSLNVK